MASQEKHHFVLGKVMWEGYKFIKDYGNMKCFHLPPTRFTLCKDIEMEKMCYQVWIELSE